MSKNDDRKESGKKDAQLDLLRTTAEIPQANSIALFIDFLNLVHAGNHDLDELARMMLIDARTVRYYSDFSRWLKFSFLPEKGVIKLTDIGRIFTKNLDMRARLFRDAMFARSLIRDIQKIKRETGDADTKRAAMAAIAARSELSEATIKRRASGITTMLEIAYKPSAINWENGDTIEPSGGSFEYEGRAFLTAMAARSFGASGIMHVGFPRQVKAFVVDAELEFSQKTWGSATQEIDDAPWFGNVPVNSSTISTLKRGGPDLRALLSTTVPYITLALSMLSLQDHQRSVLTWSTDMYGIRVWFRGRDIGSPIKLIEKALSRKGIGILKHSGVGPFSEQSTDQDLVDILEAVGLIKIDDTTIRLRDPFGFESRESSEVSSSTHDRLIVLEDLWDAILES